jgi:predicted patatin/cPLA2 family phospholipase
MEYMFIILFIAFIIVIFLDTNEKNKQINKLKEENEMLRKEIEQSNKVYEKDLKNFKKLLKMCGKEIEFIPYSKFTVKRSENGFDEIREDYVIPEIHITFGYGCKNGEYDLGKMIKESEEDEGKINE